MLAANKAEGGAGEPGARRPSAWAWASRCRSRPSTARAWPTSTTPCGPCSRRPSPSRCPRTTRHGRVRIAIVGRPNAGKSTLVNRLIGEERMLTGPEAGITRDAIPVDWTWDGRPDAAGRHRRPAAQGEGRRRSWRSSRPPTTIRAITFAEVVVAGDGRHPAVRDPGPADRRPGRARGPRPGLRAGQVGPGRGPAGRARKALHRVPQRPAAAAARRAGGGAVGRDRPRPRPADAGGVQGAPATGRPRSRPATSTTGWRWPLQRHPPPARERAADQAKYMAQTKARPPTFVLFASRADQMPESYRRYLVNSLRESFDLPGRADAPPPAPGQEPLRRRLRPAARVRRGAAPVAGPQGEQGGLPDAR